MDALKSLFAFIFGSVLYIFFFAITIFSLPLNVIALMHLWGYEWWSALILSVGMQLIPLLGQLAYIVLAVMGAFFFYQADFNWREATQPSIKTFNMSALSAAQFEEYKKTKIYPEVFGQCLRSGKERYGFEGKVPANVSTFCECYSGVVVATISQKHIVENVKPDDMEERIKVAFLAKCKPIM